MSPVPTLPPVGFRKARTCVETLARRLRYNFPKLHAEGRYFARRLQNPSESLHHLTRDVAPGPIGVSVRPAGADRRQRDRAGLLLRDAVTGTHHFGGLRLEDSVAQLEAVPRRPHLVGLELHPYDVPLALLGGFNGVAAMLIALFADLDRAHRVAELLHTTSARGVGIKRRDAEVGHRGRDKPRTPWLLLFRLVGRDFGFGDGPRFGLIDALDRRLRLGLLLLASRLAGGQGRKRGEREQTYQHCENRFQVAAHRCFSHEVFQDWDRD